MGARICILAAVVSTLCIGTACSRTNNSLTSSDAATNSAKCQPRAQAISWLGEALVAPQLPSDIRMRFEAELASAQADAIEHPHDVNAQIWLGRRLAYLGQYDKAIAVFGRALIEHPESAALYRHRGHRYITTRNLGAARRDFQQAANLMVGQPDEVEPDGLPNAKNMPRSTLQGNVWYHLGLIEFLSGNFPAAEEAFRRAIAVSQNDDSTVAALNWLYMILRRQDRKAEADAALAHVNPRMDVIENQAYLRLLLLYRGELTLDDFPAATGTENWQDPAISFAIAHLWLVDGNETTAYAQWQNLAQNGRWDAFGTIAAEAELVRRNPL
jgi:Flp pilus assembly protein TadD